MTVFYNIARMTTSTTGSETITLGSAVAGCITFAQAGIQNGDSISYGIIDGPSSEVGTGVYTSSTSTLTRSVANSTNGGNLLYLSVNAQVFITAIATDFNKISTFLDRAANTGHYTGFPNRTSSSLVWDNGTSGSERTLTLSGSNFKIYINGVEYNIISNMKKQIPDTTGLYWFWIDLIGGVPTLEADVNSPGFDKCLVATVYWNATIDNGILGEERHWMGRDQWMHEYLHETVGVRYYTGLTITPSTTGSFSITDGEMYDEDIEIEIDPTQTNCNRLYKNGSANWEWDTSASIIPKVVANQLQYNNENILAYVGVNNYVAMWIFGTNDIAVSIMAMLGQRTDNTIANARENNTPDTLSFGTLPSAEMKLLYRVIYKDTNGAPYFTYVETADYRAVSNLPVANYTATDHSTLTNLTYATAAHTGFEADLGTPAVSGYILSSTTTGVRSWIIDSGGATVLENQVFS